MRDNNQRRAPLNTVIDTAMRGALKDTFTSVPGHVIAFDAATQRAQVQIGIVRVDINGATFEIPPIVDVPVSFPGDDYVLEYEIKPGCEGDIHFSQRCMDGWKQTGGIAANPVARFHNKQDAKFIPGIRSLTNAIANFANNGIRLRDKTGNRYVWIKNDDIIEIKNASATTTYAEDGTITTQNDSGHMTLMADGNVDINGVIITPQGQIMLPGTGGLKLANGIDAESHKHTGVTTGSGTSGGPTN